MLIKSLCYSFILHHSSLLDYLHNQPVTEHKTKRTDLNVKIISPLFISSCWSRGITPSRFTWGTFSIWHASMPPIKSKHALGSSSRELHQVRGVGAGLKCLHLLFPTWIRTTPAPLQPRSPASHQPCPPPKKQEPTMDSDS